MELKRRDIELLADCSRNIRGEPEKFTRSSRAEIGLQSRREPDGRFYKWRDDAIVPVICPTCQNVFAGNASMPAPPPCYFAWGCFRYFGWSEAHLAARKRLVPLAGIEPALLAELDFESSASTNSATGAYRARPERLEVAKPAEYSGRGGRVNPRVSGTPEEIGPMARAPSAPASMTVEPNHGRREASRFHPSSNRQNTPL